MKYKCKDYCQCSGLFQNLSPPCLCPECKLCFPEIHEKKKEIEQIRQQVTANTSPGDIVIGKSKRICFSKFQQLELKVPNGQETPPRAHYETCNYYY